MLPRLVRVASPLLLRRDLAFCGSARWFRSKIGIRGPRNIVVLRRCASGHPAIAPCCQSASRISPPPELLLRRCFVANIVEPTDNESFLMNPTLTPPWFYRRNVDARCILFLLSPSYYKHRIAPFPSDERLSFKCFAVLPAFSAVRWFHQHPTFSGNALSGQCCQPIRQTSHHLMGERRNP